MLPDFCGLHGESARAKVLISQGKPHLKQHEMKRLLITGLVLLNMMGASASFAQSKRTYDDDIYYNSKAAKEEPPAEEEQPAKKRASQQREDENDTYSSSGNNYDSRSNSSNKSYDDEDDYVNYDDDYYYSTQINRFNNPFYNRPYWSSFYNPYWYDPFWVDPYWGWSPWARPGFSVSFGGGPYWSSYWGWQSWYGCGGFNSYYGNPGYGMYGGYYSGYWNGYYAGLYNNYGYGNGRYRTVTYGPRYSLNARTNSRAHNVGSHGFRREANPGTMQTAPASGLSTPRMNGMRTADGTIDRSGRGRGTAIESAGSGRDIRNAGVESIDRPRENGGTNEPGIIRDNVRSFDNDRAPIAESPRSSRWNSGDVRNNEQMSAPSAQPRRERGSLFGGRSEAPVRSNDQPRMEQRSFSQPRMEQRSAPAPRMEAPSRSSMGSGGGSRSMGSSGGGGFRGGRR